jgi:hypothetical protein
MLLRKTDARDGNVAVIVAVCLVAILGSVALSLDGGQQLDKRRQIQCAADAAALTAAGELYAHWWATTPRGTDTPDGHARQLAHSVAAKNGFSNGVNGCTVTVNIPPLYGPFAGVASHAEVIIVVDQARFFSRIFTNATVEIGARAVARGTRNRVNNGIIVLDPDDKGAFVNGGNGLVTVGTDAAVLVNSANSEAVITNGNGATSIYDYPISTGDPGAVNVTGGYSGIGFNSNITWNTGVEPTPDPLRFLPPPDPSTLTIQSTKKIQHSGANTLTLNPGIYMGGVSVTGKGSLFLNPGIYYMQGGGFSVGAQGSLTGNGVMIYNAPLSNSDVIDISGTGAGGITLSPMLTGPYAGVVLYQQRDAPYQPDVSVTGNGNMNLSGTFYVPGALLKVTGNGANDVIGSQYISNTLKLGGNGNFTVDWNPDVIPGLLEIYVVE